MLKSTRAALISSLLLCAACGEPVSVATGSDSGEAATEVDSGQAVTPPDTGSTATPPDAGSTTIPPDAGATEPGPDAGSTTVPPDAGAEPGPDAGGVPGPDAGGSGSCVSTAPANFSFFVMSLETIREQSGSQEGFGGALGGLSGADEKCTYAARAVGSCKTWRAFLSVTDDGSGNPVDAIDRIGSGPWYDVNGHLLANDTSELVKTRPGSDTDIVWTSGYQQWPFNQCLTTELGNCNHSYGDTHDTLTGSNRQGRLYSTDMKYTCNDWTSSNVSVQLPIGHSWPRQLNGTSDGECHWLYSHSNCTGGGGPGGGGGSCNGCGANINLTDSMESGVGGDGGYGAWYCFAID